MKNAEDRILDAKEALPNITPTPPGLKPQSSPKDLKDRLEWGEPGLTILDVRDRETYNKGHIMGAMSMPLDQLTERVQSALQPERDIYLYGASDAETNQAAAQLREAGFDKVAEIVGGYAAWKAVEGAREGTEENPEPGADAYNVVSRIAKHQETQKRS